MYDTSSHVRRRASLGRDAWGFHEGAMPPIGSELASIYPSKEPVDSRDDRSCEPRAGRSIAALKRLRCA